MCRPDGSERDVGWSAFGLTLTNTTYAVATISDITDTRQAAREAAALAQAAAVTTGASTREILAEIAKAAVTDTRASGCGIAVVHDDGLIVTGGYASSGRSATPSPAA